jgi:hypothetical protein
MSPTPNRPAGRDRLAAVGALLSARAGSRRPRPVAGVGRDAAGEVGLPPAITTARPPRIATMSRDRQQTLARTPVDAWHSRPRRLVVASDLSRKEGENLESWTESARAVHARHEGSLGNALGVRDPRAASQSLRARGNQLEATVLPGPAEAQEALECEEGRACRAGGGSRAGGRSCASISTAPARVVRCI